MHAIISLWSLALITVPPYFLAFGSGRSSYGLRAERKEEENNRVRWLCVRGTDWTIILIKALDVPLKLFTCRYYISRLNWAFQHSGVNSSHFSCKARSALNYNAQALICGRLKDKRCEPFYPAGWKRLWLRLVWGTTHLDSGSRVEKKQFALSRDDLYCTVCAATQKLLLGPPSCTRGCDSFGEPLLLCSFSRSSHRPKICMLKVRCVTFEESERKRRHRVVTVQIAALFYYPSPSQVCQWNAVACAHKLRYPVSIHTKCAGRQPGLSIPGFHRNNGSARRKLTGSMSVYSLMHK